MNTFFQFVQVIGVFTIGIFFAGALILLIRTSSAAATLMTVGFGIALICRLMGVILMLPLFYLQLGFNPEILFYISGWGPELGLLTGGAGLLWFALTGRNSSK